MIVDMVGMKRTGDISSTQNPHGISFMQGLPETMLQLTLILAMCLELLIPQKTQTKINFSKRMF